MMIESKPAINPNDEVDLEAMLSDLIGDDEIVIKAEEEVEVEDDFLKELELELSAAESEDPEVPKVAVETASTESVTEVEHDGEEAVELVAEAVEVKAKKEKTKKEKKPLVRKCYASKSERLQDKLGSDLDGYMVREVKDALLDEAGIAAAVEETKKAIKEAGVKVQNRITFIIEFISGRSANLSPLVKSAFDMLEEEGKLTTGDKGNFYLKLLAHPYKEKSARSMGANTIAAMRVLKCIVPGENPHEWVANPDSLVLAKIRPMLGYK